MPVEYRPVDEEQALLGARLARGLPEVARLSSPDGGEALPLRTVGVPEDVVLDERASRAEHDGDRLLRPEVDVLEVGEEVFERALEDATEDGIVGKDACGRQSLHLVPRDEEAASVDEPRLDAAFGELVAKPARKGLQERAAGPSIASVRGLARTNASASAPKPRSTSPSVSG